MNKALWIWIQSCLQKIAIFFIKHEYFGLFLLLSFTLFIFFFDIILLNASFSTASLTHGTLPTGPYDYPPDRILTYLPIIDPGASAWCFEPWTYYIAEGFKSGIIPLWYPYQGMGAPLISNYQSAFFYPVNLLINCIPETCIPFFLDMSILLKLLAAGFFTYCFMRELSFNKKNSFLSAIIFMFCGYFTYYINMVHLNTEVLIPLLFFMLEKILRKQDFIYTVIGAFVVALIIYGGMPESVLFALAFGTLYYLFRLVMINWPSLELNKLLKPFLLLICVMSVGLLLAAPQILPFIELLQNSYTFHHTLTGIKGVAFSFDTITLIVPYFYGILWNNWTSYNIHKMLPFIGICALYLVFLSYRDGNRRENTLTFFFGAIAIFYLLKFYEVPLVNWVGYLPFFNVSIFPKYLHPEFVFSIAVLAGIGFNNVLNMNLKKILLNFSIILFIISIFFYFNFQSAQIKIWAVNLFNWKFNAVSWMILNFGIAFVFLSLITLVLILGYFKKIRKENAARIVIFLVVAELFLYVPHIHPERVDPFNEPPYIAFLKSDQEMFRVIGLNGILHPNTAAPYHVFDVRIFDSLYVDRYHLFIEKLIDPAINTTRFTGKGFSIHRGNSRYLELCNVKYILSTDYLTFASDKSSLIQKIQEQGNIHSDQQKYVSIKPETGDIFAHPKTNIFVNITIPDETSYLVFTYGLDQNTWSQGKGDGVSFQVLVQTENSRQEIFFRHVDPSGNVQDRKWFSEIVNLSEYRGQDVQLQFVTMPGPRNDSAYDWAHWKNPDIVSSREIENLKKYETNFLLVYDDEIKIYQDLNVIPRVFIVDDVIVKNTTDDIFRSLEDPALNLSGTIILEKEIPEFHYFKNRAGNISDLRYSAEIIEYNPNYVQINATLNKPGFLVITDTFYPGWKATVDGKPREILPADFMFRAVYLGEGIHEVRLTYEPMTFTIGLFISFSTLIGILIIFILKCKKIL